MLPCCRVCKISTFYLWKFQRYDGSQIYNRGAVPLRRLFAKKITSEKSTLPYRCVYNFNFLSLVVPEIWWGPKFTIGALRPSDAHCKKIYTRKEYVTLSVCVKFQLSISDSSRDIMGVPNLQLGRCVLRRPLRKKNYTRKEYVQSINQSRFLAWLK